MAVKTDKNKAYYRLEWSFIRRVFERQGFDDRWTNWVIECTSALSYSFMLGNEVVGSVIPERGIRQGDPLSPYIFILCAKVFSGMCSKAQRDGLLTRVRVSNQSPKFNHLLFADDTMFFTKTNDQCCSTLLHILSDYELASGQKINTEKSSIFFSAISLHTVCARVKQQLRIKKEGGVGKYMGLPEHFSRKKKDLFASIVDRMK